MKSSPAPIIEAPQVSKAEATPRMRGVASFALKLMAEATALPFVTVDTYSRPLVRVDRFASRARLLLTSADMAALIAGLSAPTPAEAMQAVDLVEKMYLQPGSSAALTPWTGANPANVSLLHYLTDTIVDLMYLSEADRAQYAAKMAWDGWQLDICAMPPFFARLAWKLDGVQHLMVFRPTQETLDLQPEMSPATLGLSRVTVIPFRVLAAAATACVEANRRAATSKSRTMKPAGLRASASLVPKMEKAAGPDDHSDLSISHQPEAGSSNSLVGLAPANEQTHEVPNEQSKASSTSVQRLARFWLVAPPPRKVTPRVFAPSGASPPCPETTSTSTSTATSRLSTRRPSSSPTLLPQGALRRRTPRSTHS